MTEKPIPQTVEQLNLQAFRQIDEIIIHCSATPQGRPFTVEDIHRWHLANGWKNGCGYHFVIHLDGEVKAGRPLNLLGAHCVGHNATSIGICYIGGCAPDGKTPKDTRTAEQKSSLRLLLSALRERYPHARIHGHRDFAAKACPSFDATSEYADI